MQGRVHEQYPLTWKYLEFPPCIKGKVSPLLGHFGPVVLLQLKNIETINLTEANDYVYVGKGYSSVNKVTIDGKLGVNTIDFSNATTVEVTLDIATLALTNTLVSNVDFKNFRNTEI